MPGQWIGHLLDLDIVSQGNDLAHARGMLTEAIFDTLKAALLSSRSPLHRQKAPEADWEELFDVLRRGQRLEGAGSTPIVSVTRSRRVLHAMPQWLPALTTPRVDRHFVK